MKNLILLASILVTSLGYSQSKPYWTSGLEFIFSYADIQDNGKEESSSIRFAPVINLQSMINKDISDKFGLFSGIAVRNVGYIYKDYKLVTSTNTVSVEKRFRSYNLAVPIGIKLGNLDKAFIYGGYEFELPFLYKEKMYTGGDKTDKITGWFSDRQEQFQHGFLVGVQFPYGMNLKFKYYMTEFHNQNYTDETGNKPYQGLTSHIFYFSLNACLFTNSHLSVTEKTSRATD